MVRRYGRQEQRIATLETVLRGLLAAFETDQIDDFTAYEEPIPSAVHAARAALECSPSCPDNLSTGSAPKWTAEQMDAIACVQRVSYLEGQISAIRDYAVWRDGTQWVDVMRKPLRELIGPLQEEIDAIKDGLTARTSVPLGFGSTSMEKAK